MSFCLNSENYFKLYQMTDRDIIETLIRGDNEFSSQFFFKDCKPLFTSIIHHVFPFQVDYDEFVNELYVYLMENDAFRLRQYEGRSSVYQWLKIVTLRFAIKLQRKGRMIESGSKESPYINSMTTVDDTSKHAEIDINLLLSQIKNERQVYVIQRHVIDGVDEPTLAKEMGIKVSNLYNIKKRAMTALVKVALLDIKLYGKRI